MRNLQVAAPGGPPVFAEPGAYGELRCHIEGARTVNGRQVLVYGWVADVEAGVLYLGDASLASPPTRLDPVVTPREDISAHLTQFGHRATTNRHGFMATIRREGASPSKVRLCFVAQQKAVWSVEFELKPERVSLRELLGTALGAVQQSGRHISQDLERLTRPLVDDAPPPPSVADVRVFAPPGGIPAARPRASIIIPFYGDGSFLLDHLLAQRRAPADVEWVIVCDDPRLSDMLTQTMAHRKTAVRQATSLVYLGSNGGFAHANNIGAAHARGEYLLLMNSDVYCRDFGFVDRGVSLMASDPKIGCVGFSMQFEDGTVQHDGMRFRKVPWFDDLWASEHPGKGMPHRWHSASHAEAEAVTAALMLLRRADFEGGRVFDPGYIVGDFEDADLCLRLREQGRSIALVRTDGLWHLERQSVRHIPDDEGRRAITLLNCLRFNSRWGTMLDDAERSTRRVQ
jgi:GT2 family glycosyltransferase